MQKLDHMLVRFFSNVAHLSCVRLSVCLPLHFSFFPPLISHTHTHNHSVAFLSFGWLCCIGLQITANIAALTTHTCFLAIHRHHYYFLKACWRFVVVLKGIIVLYAGTRLFFFAFPHNALSPHLCVFCFHVTFSKWFMIILKSAITCDGTRSFICLLHWLSLSHNKFKVYELKRALNVIRSRCQCCEGNVGLWRHLVVMWHLSVIFILSTNRFWANWGCWTIPEFWNVIVELELYMTKPNGHDLLFI